MRLIWSCEGTGNDLDDKNKEGREKEDEVST